MKPERIEQVSTIENPTKAKRINNAVELSREQFLSLDPKVVSYSSWGSVVNNPCEEWKLSDGRVCEVYCSFGWLYRYFTEAIKEA